MAIAALNPGFSTTYQTSTYSAPALDLGPAPASGNPAASLGQAAGQWESFLGQNAPGREGLMASLQAARERLDGLRDSLDESRRQALTEQGVAGPEAERLVAAQRQVESLQARQVSLADRRNLLSQRRESLSGQLEQARAAADAPLPDPDDETLPSATQARDAARARVEQLEAQLEALNEEERGLEQAIQENEESLSAARNEVAQAQTALSVPTEVLSVDEGLMAEIQAAEAEVQRLEGELATLEAQASNSIVNAQEGIHPTDAGVSSIPIADESDREAIEAAQEATIAQALATGQPVSFQNSQGTTANLTITLVDGVYQVSDGDGDIVSIEWDGTANDPLGAVTRAADYWTQIPEALQEPSTRIIVHTGDSNLEDSLAGEVRDGAIHFYNTRDQDTGLYYTAEDNLNERVFTHEYGHIVGQRFQGNRDLGAMIFNSNYHNVPSDFGFTYGHGDERHSPTGYGDDQWAGEGALSFRVSHEAFAEHWTLYNEAFDQGPEALSTYRAVYPQESAWFEQFFSAS